MSDGNHTTTSNGIPQDPDDFFAETRMSFGEHIEELRHHLWRAIGGFGVALLLSFFVGHIVVDWITAPVRHELNRFYERRLTKVLKDRGDKTQKTNQPTQFRPYLVVTKQLQALADGKNADIPRPRILTKEQREEQKNPPSLWKRWFGVGDVEEDPTLSAEEIKEGNFTVIPDEDKERHLTRLWLSMEKPLYVQADQQPGLRDILDLDNPTTLNVQEAFFVWFKVCMVTGIVIGSPWIFWQIWMFIAAGLYPTEKRLVHVYLPVSLFLFLAGVLLCEIFVIPKAIEALLWFNEWLGFKPDLRLNEWLSFAIYMPLVFGLSFQTPLVMLFLHRLGIMNADSFRNRRRMAWFVMAVFAAVITPSTDALSMLFLWVPMSLLFELGILLIKLSPREPQVEEDVPETDELVEV